MLRVFASQAMLDLELRAGTDLQFMIDDCSLSGEMLVVRRLREVRDSGLDLRLSEPSDFPWP